MREFKSGESFIDSIYQELINSEEVKNAIERKGVNPKTREDYIKTYMDRLEKAHSNERKITLLKSIYYKRYVIDNLPESYISSQKKIARERGYGNVELTEQMEIEMLKKIQEEQKSSLDSWLAYLNSEDAMYPMWFKYYAFQGMLKLGKFDKEKGKFTKRTKDTVLPFIDVNPEILGQMYTMIYKMVNKEEMTDNEINALNSGESFTKLYTYLLNEMNDMKKEKISNEGIWIKYDQGGNYQKLWQSLQGKNTGWCTAGEETCKTQIKNGDFYVYYTKNENNEYTDPRIAIRMDGHNKIGEVRGIDKNQNLESEMIEIADKKLDEFPDKVKYKKKVHDMKLLTIIENKTNNGEELTKEEISFLYEIEFEIEGFGWEKDPRVEEIKEKRNIKKDLANLYDCKEENIGTEISDFDKHEIVVYTGSLKLESDYIPDNFKFLKIILGNANFNSLTDARGLERLQRIDGEANFDSLTNAQGLCNLQSIGGNALFSSLTDAQGLESLQSIGWNANFDSLTNAQGLENLQSIGWDANFDSLTDAQGLCNLQSIGRQAVFRNLTDARGLERLQRIDGEAYFDSLTDAQGLESLQSIGGEASFSSLTDARGLERLQRIGGEASFKSLKDSKGLENLQSIGYIANFDSLTDAQGLCNLQSIGYSANFDSLTDAQGLENLQSIGGNASFRNLTDARGLERLQRIGGATWFKSLKDSKGLENLQSIGRDAYFDSLTNAQGLCNLQSIGYSAYFDSLTDAQGLESLQSIGGNALFSSLTDAQGLESLQSIGWDAYFDSLTNAQGLENLQSIGWDANFDSLTNAQGLENLQSIGKDAYFDSLTDAQGLENLQRVGGSANFDSLTYSKGLESLQSIGGYAWFKSLTDTRGLESLQSIGESAYFDSLTDSKSIEHIKINDKLYISNNISIEHKTK